MISTTRNRLVAVLTSLVCAGVAWAQLPPPPPEMVQPTGGLGEIKFDGMLFDFGKIWDHKKVTHKFAFTNVGNEELTVTDVKSSCGCTIPELTTKVYAPGESGEITVIFNPANRHGNQNKVITVTTNSRKTPTARVTINAYVTKVLDIQPPLANLGRIFKNEEKGMKVHIIGKIPDFKAWPADEQPEESSMFHVEVEETKDVDIEGETRRRTTLHISVKKGLAVGRHSGSLKILTNDKRRPEIELRCVATVVGDLQGRPPRFALGRLEPGQDFETTTRLVNRIADPFKIVKIDSTGDVGKLDISFAPVEEGKNDAYDITVRGVAPAENERILGRILVYTDMKTEPMIELPIYGFVNRSTNPVSKKVPAGG